MNIHNVNLKHLRAFVAVADAGSFVTAALLLHMSQPALSQCVRQFEERIGAPLLHRTTRRVGLTALGLSLLPRARHLLTQFDTMIGDVTDAVNHKRGRVAVACLPSVAYRLMPRVVATHERRFPGVRVVVLDKSLAGIIDALLSGEADLGIGSSITDVHDLSSAPLARESFSAVFPYNSPLKDKRKVTWEELARFPFIAMTHQTGIRSITDFTIGQQNLELRIVAEVTNVNTLFSMVEEGIGVSALPGFVLPRHELPHVRFAPLSPVIERSINVFWRTGYGPSPSARGLVAALNECISERSFEAQLPNVYWQECILPPPFANRS